MTLRTLSPFLAPLVVLSACSTDARRTADQPAPPTATQAQSSTAATATPPDPSVTWRKGPPNTSEPAYSACHDALGDATSEPDLSLVALDRPEFPFAHFHWAAGGLPSEGTVEAVIEATSADGERSRQLVLVIVDGAIESQSWLDRATGERQSRYAEEVTDAVDEGIDRLTGVELLGSKGVAGSFPAYAVMPLDDAWTWTSWVTVDGTVVDSADGACS